MVLRTFFKLTQALAQEMQNAQADVRLDDAERALDEAAMRFKAATDRAFQPPPRPSAEERRRRSAKVIIERRKTEQVLSTDMPFSFKELAAMVDHLRPGMGLAELQAIEAESLSILTTELLTSDAAWKKAYDQRMPCKVGLTKDGVIERVFFGYHDPENVHQYRMPEQLLRARPGSAFDPAREISGNGALRERAVVLPDTGQGYRVLITYKGGLILTSYEAPEAYGREVARLERRKAKLAAWQDAAPEDTPSPHRPQGALSEFPTAAEADALLLKHYEHSADQDDDPGLLDMARWIVEESNPDDKHVLSSSNLDFGTKIHLWVIRQPDTPLATVLNLLWFAGAEHWFLNPEDQGQEQALLREVAARLRAGYYSIAEGDAAIAYEPPSYVMEKPEVVEKLRSVLPPAAFEPLEGRDPMSIGSRFPRYWNDYIN